MMKADADDHNDSDEGDEPPRDTSKFKPAVALEGDDAPPQKKQGGAPGAKTGFANFFQSTGLCCFKFKEQTHISAIEMKITNRQKKFGVDYLTLVEEQASQDQLKQCLKVALKEISELQSAVNERLDKIDDKEVEVKQKIEENNAAAEEAAQNKPKKKKKKKPKEEGVDTVEPDTDRDLEADNEGTEPKKKATKKKKKKKKPVEHTEEE